MLSRRFPFTRLRFSFVAALVAIAMWLSAPGGVAEAAGSWTNVIGLPMQTVNHCAAVLNDKLYVLGGGTIPNSYSSTNAFRLDGTNWTSIPWAPVGGFGGLISAGAATLNGTLYLIGGHNGSSERTNVYSFNGTNWTVAPSLPAARQYLAACTFQSKIYAIGGRFGVSAQTNVYCFDGTNWSETVGLPVVNMALSASVHNGRLYAVGGYDGVTPSYTNVYRFDGTNWTAVAGLPVPRSHHSTAEMGGRLYAMGGVYGTVHSNVYCYDGTNWTESPGLPLAKGYLAAAATLGNKIYHTGGSTDMANGVTNVFAWVDPSVKLDQLITFVPVPPQKVSGSVGLAATASSGLPVGFAVGSGPASITGGTNLSFTGVGTVSIVVSQSGDATYNPAPNVTNTFHVYALSAYSGPFAGGNTITITNGNFGTITNVLVGGVASTIEASGANWVRITVPAAGSAGAKDLVIQTSDNGDKTLAAAYTVNPAGDISGGTGSRMWQSVGQALVPGQVSAVGANNTIYGMDYYGNNLYIGGAFTNAGGSNCYRVARHDGTNWHSMQAGVLRVANVNCIKGSPHGIYSGGYFTNIGGSYNPDGTMNNDGGVNAYAAARFDGTSWNAMGHAPLLGNKTGLYFTVSINGYVNWMEPYKDDTVIAVGYFTNSDYRAAGLNYIAKYDGAGWTNMQGGFRNVPLAAAYDRDRDHLYVGGSFTNHYPTNTSRHIRYIARWDGVNWTNMAQGFGNRVTCMAVNPANGELYIGGWFTNYFDSAGDPHPANYVAKWDPVSQSLTNVGSGFNNWVYALKVAPDGTLYAGGSFTNTYISTEPDKSAPQLAVRRIAMWNGTHWTNMGRGLSDTVLSLTVNTNNNDVYAGGYFRIATQDDGTDTNTWHIASYGAGGVTSTGVDPDTGPITGGFEVVISGSNLGSGDITNVTLCGVSVASIVSQSATQVVVVAAAGDPGMGDVRVYSASYGETVKSDAFTYTGPLFALLGANGAAVASGEAVSEAKGTDFGTINLGDAATNRFAITNAGDAVLTISSWPTNGTGAGAFAIAGMPVTVAAGTISNFSVIFTPVSAGTSTCTVSIVNSSTNTPYLLNLSGHGVKQNQTITFPAIPDQLTTNLVGLAATASSGLAVQFSVGGGSALITGDTNLSFTGTGSVLIVASQIGDANWNPAPNVTNTFNVTKAAAGVYLQDLAQTYDGTARSVTATSDPSGLTIEFTYNGNAWAPTNAGSYAITGVVNDVMYQGSQTGTLVISKGAASVYLLDLAQTYDGTAKSVTATSDPAGLTIEFTYNGNAWAPTNAGSYAVTGTVNDVNWVGSADGTLVVSKGTAGVYLLNLAQTYDGLAKSVTATSDPSGLTIEFSYNGNAWAPTNAGSYAVTGTVNDANWQGSADGTLVVSKGAAEVYLLDLAQTYDGTARSVAATSDPSGLTIEFTYNGNAWAPTNTGSYAVTGTVNDANWQGTADGTLVVSKGTAGLYLLDLTQMYDGTARSVTATSDPSGLTIEFTYNGNAWAPTNAGSYAVTGTVNDANWVGSADGILVVSKGIAGVYLSDLSQTYDGSAKSVTATSDPSGLTIEFTYSGNAWAPTNAGSYAVTGTVNDVNWVGSADGTLVVSKGTAGVYLLNLAQTYDGLAKSVTATSDPSGLTIEFSYNGNAWAPTNAGSYAVTGTVNDANWQGSADGTLVVSKGAAEVYLLDLAQTYDGTARSVAATSDPSGLTIEFTYNGNAWAPTNTGSYAVTGTVNDANWQGTADGTLVVSKGAANVYLLDLTQTYDGTAKSASATTMPAGLTVEFTYNGSSTSPSEAGSYAVTGTVNDANWQGEETGTLTIGKAGQTITFSPVAPQKASAIVGLAATGGGSGNPVTFAAGAPGVITDGTNLSYTGVGDVIVVASQAGNADYEAAPDVTNVVKVFSVTPDVGPFAGGHNATISNGYFGTITNVLVGGVAAAIQSSGANWVTLTVPAVGSHGIKDIVIQTSDNGETTLPDAYTVAVRAEDLPLGSLVYDDDWTWSGLPLKWRVVDTNYGGTAGLVTLQATSSLGGRAYHEGAWANQWGSCTLRTWLNSTNFHGGFSPAFSGAVVCTRVPWTTYNSAGAFVSGITTDQVFIASRTELGGDVWASEGEVLDWFSDPGTAAARRSDLSPSPMNYWTRSGMRAMWGVTYYDLAAYYAAVPGGAIAYGPWTGDALGVVPMVNIGGPVEFAVQPDGTYRLYEGPLPQSITFPNPGPQFTTNVVALSATASSGQDVIYSVLSGPASVAGGILTFTGTGDVTVIASHPGNAYWNPAPNLTNAFTVTKATASLALTNLNQIYSGSAREAGYETVPAGLTVLLTYDGNLWAPTNAGSYAVAGVVDDVMWQGSQTGTLTVAKADQTIAFPPIADQLTTNEVGLAATAASGFDVTFFAGAPPAVIMGGTNLSFTGTGMVSVVASQAGDANWNPAPDVTNTFTVTKAAASLTLTNLNQACDGTARTAGYAVVPSGLTVLLTYNGNVWAPTNVGSYAVTGVVDDVMWQGLATGTLVVVKGDQIITNFLPADGAVFVLGTATSVSAQASSGLAVGFNNLTPEIASLTGTAIAFTNPGAARVQAFQPGDANWNAAVPVVHEWRVGGLITNIMPGAANVGGGIEVLIQGLWLGDGSNITTVELAGVAADIVTQGVHEVTVTAGAAPAAVTGDVFVVSGTGGEMWMSNAFEYLWFDAPVQLDPVDITASNLVARWLLAAGADKHILEVGLDTNFTAHLPGYEAVDVALAQQYLVAGLTEGTWYAMRLFAWNTNGYSPPSRTVWVPAGTNLPYVTHPPMGGPVTEDAVMQFTLACMFHGSGLIYTAESSDTNIVGVSIAGGVLEIDPRNPGTATITVTATDPATGYSASYSFVIEVVGTVPFSSAFQDREIWNPRFTQRLWVTNDLAIDAIGIRVLFAGLLPGIIVENQTGISVDGRPMIEMEAPFPPDGTMELDIIYICTGAETVSDYPPVVEVQYILPGWRPPLPGEGVPVGVKLVFDAERVLLEFDTTVGMLYAIEYMNNFPAGTWREVSLRLRATANRTQWIDAGPPATLPFEGLRVYRIKAVAE